MNRVAPTFLVVLVWTSTVAGQTPACDALSGSERRLAESVMATEYLGTAATTPSLVVSRPSPGAISLSGSPTTSAAA